MVRVPRGMHRAAGAGYRPLGPAPRAAWRPGRIPVGRYTQVINGVPLVGGQGTAIVADGTATVQLGPAGLGNVWYPAQATIQTTSGVSDTSTLNAYLGPSGVPVTLVGTAYPGGTGTIALAVPSMTPGQYLIFTWTGANDGDLASVNVIGTMSSVAPSPRR
jgi:hypothetical protein